MVQRLSEVGSRRSVNRIALGMFDPGVLVGSRKSIRRGAPDSEWKGVVTFYDDVAFGVSHNTPDPGLVVVAVGGFGSALSEAFAIDLRRNRLARDLHVQVL